MSTGTGTEFSVPVPNVMFWINISILAITWPFLIRFECFKCLVKLEFKEKKHPEIGTFTFGLDFAQKFTQIGARFKPISGSVLNIE